MAASDDSPPETLHERASNPAPWGADRQPDGAASPSLGGTIPDGAIACVECGAWVSPKARRCPHCHTRDFRGLPCGVCNQPAKPSEVVCDYPSGVFFHPTCLAELERLPARCGFCGNLAIAAAEAHCPHCGHRLSLATCQFCQRPFSPEVDPFEGSLSKIVANGFEQYVDLVPAGTAHRRCAEARGGFPRLQIYRDLFDALSAERWEAADRETDRLLRYFARDCSFAQFPCDELYAIDLLWSRASNGRFGLRVQARIWNEIGDRFRHLPEPDRYERFAERVGWQRRRGAAGGPQRWTQSARRVSREVRTQWTQLAGGLPARLLRRFRPEAPPRPAPTPRRRAAFDLPYAALQFDLSAPEGHLPFPGSATGGNFGLGRSPEFADAWDVPALAARLAACEFS